MKIAKIIWLLMSIVSTGPALACDLWGVRGAIADDGQSIAKRQFVPIKEQARRYGGYQEAADAIEQNRRHLMRNGDISSPVKHQVDSDLKFTVEQLKCWGQRCKRNATNSACQF